MRRHSADTGHFVGGDGNTHTGAADEDGAVCVTVGYLVDGVNVPLL